MNQQESDLTISQALALARSGTPVYQNSWGNHTTYISYRGGKYYFETYDRSRFNCLVDVEEVDEEIAAFSLLETYNQD